MSDGRIAQADWSVVALSSGERAGRLAIFFSLLVRPLWLSLGKEALDVLRSFLGKQNGTLSDGCLLEIENLSLTYRRPRE